MSDADPWYLRTALARLRSGWRIRFDGKTYHIYGEFGDVGLCEDACHALAYYMLQCSLGPQQPLKPSWQDVLPLMWGEDEVAVVEGQHQPALYDGTPRGPL
jgi:hypothetical protein